MPGPPLVPDPLQPAKVCLSNRLLGNEKVECARMTQMNWARTAARFQHVPWCGMSLIRPKFTLMVRTWKAKDGCA
jgi:hypothetical protein